MFNRLLSLPLHEKQSLFLFGPRGTGKTKWLQMHLPDAIYLDLLDAKLHRMLQGYPEQLRTLIPSAYTGWIVILFWL